MQPKSEDNSDGATGETSPRKADISPEIMDILWPALQVGGLSGMLC